MSTFIVSTPLARMQPVGSEGERSHARLAALLKAHLTPAHAALFADPVPLRDGSGIDWYVEEDGIARPLSSLPPDQAQAVGAEAERLLAEIRAKADEIAGQPGGRSAAAIALRNATLHPDAADLFALDTAGKLKPVLVAWGHQAHESDVPPDFHMAAPGAAPQAPRPNTLADAPSPRPEQTPQTPPADSSRPQARNETPHAADAQTAAPPSSRTAIFTRVAGAGLWNRGFLASLLLLLAALVLFGLIVGYLVPACGLRTPFGTFAFGFSPAGACGSRVARLSLDRELAVLREQVATRRQACAAPAASPPTAPRSQDFEQRIDRRGQVQVTLIWDGTDDLDLMIKCPRGPLIHFARGERQHCGGSLDVDRNDTPDNLTTRPVENITFQNGLSEGGTYPIYVKLYRKREPNMPVPFRLRVREGEQIREIEGQLTEPNQLLPVTELKHAR